MRFSCFLVTFSFAAVAGALNTRQPEDASALMLDLNHEAIQALEDLETANTKRSGNTCNIFTATVRKDWAALSAKERTSYINAVKCLQKKPSKSDRTWAPGVRSRYDDFLAIHIDKTPQIHRTGNFLTWHRYFVWSYEKALREECGYKGAQPYWNWFAHQSDMTKSEVYDGSSTSFGGTGSYVKHAGILVGREGIFLPPGQGGGCVKDGPFKDMVVNLGPVRPGMVDLPPSPTGPLGYNPRCLRRDLTNTPMEYMNVNNLLNITVGPASHSIALFQNEFQGRFPDGFIGMHAAGHFVAGGEASDVYSSPSDPTFFLHHAMVDRIYWVWQVLHPRISDTISGTITMSNNPPSRDAVVSDLLDIGVNGASIQVKDAFDTLGNSPFCYVYL
ncbi:N-acetyl-6-hydroxytryptophan oxidase ivoB [Paramyrothecium foliicola]|nr:N-acetyl-6-hydroxytryptophan oxidase ivoB [Paramyrothecium foliicola]